MGQVYLAFSPGGRALAVKVIHPELARDPAFLARFRHEVATARQVNGAYTAPVVDASSEGESPPWLATAFVPGPPLADIVVTRGSLTPESVWRLAAGLVEALHAVHSHGLIHRDLKPANVLLAADGPRVIDFGIARALDATTATATGTIVGTASFMSPEQAEGLPVGPASDVFSLGSVLAYAATGAGPFGTGTPTSILYRIVHTQPSLEGISGPLRDLIARCLTKDPAERATLTELMDVVAAQPDSATPALSFWPSDLADAIAAYQTQITSAAPLAASSEPWSDPTPPSREPTQVAVIQPPASVAEPTVTGLHARQAPQPPAHKGSRRQETIAIGASMLMIAGVIVAVSVTANAKKARPSPATTGFSATMRRIKALASAVAAPPAPTSAFTGDSSQSPVLITFSGSGPRNSTPFTVNSSVVTALYSYNCSAFGSQGSIQADMISGNVNNIGSPSYDDQAIASIVGSGGSQTTTLYPTNQGGTYHLAVDSPCSWSIKLTGSFSRVQP